MGFAVIPGEVPDPVYGGDDLLEWEELEVRVLQYSSPQLQLSVQSARVVRPASNICTHSTVEAVDLHKFSITDGCLWSFGHCPTDILMGQCCENCFQSETVCGGGGVDYIDPTDAPELLFNT